MLGEKGLQARSRIREELPQTTFLMLAGKNDFNKGEGLHRARGLRSIVWAFRTGTVLDALPGRVAPKSRHVPLRQPSKADDFLAGVGRDFSAVVSIAQHASVLPDLDIKNAEMILLIQTNASTRYQ